MDASQAVTLLFVGFFLTLVAVWVDVLTKRPLVQITLSVFLFLYWAIYWFKFTWPKQAKSE